MAEPVLDQPRVVAGIGQGVPLKQLRPIGSSLMGFTARTKLAAVLLDPETTCRIPYIVGRHHGRAAGSSADLLRPSWRLSCRLSHH
jgi:hypothetical protein